MFAIFSVGFGRITETLSDGGTCMDTDDQTKWNGDGSTHFAADLEHCGRKCVGRSSCTASCIADTGYTADCAKCFGDLTGCTSKHCKFNCMSNPGGPKCKACVDKNCTPDFISCSGLTPPTPEFMVADLEDGGACMDSDDQAKWEADGETSFADDLENCGRPCMGGASCTAKCIKGKGYTEDCASCFGDLTGCTKKHCMFNCMSDSKGPKCKNCVESNCTPAFVACSGLNPPETLELSDGVAMCVDSDDQAKWDSDGETNFAGDLEHCGRKCVGRTTCTANCIADTGYTQDCANCFGSLTGCTSKHCKFNCMSNPQGPKCKACVDKNCTPDFEQCSGLTPPENSINLEDGGACMDAADQAKWSNDGETDFADDLESCGRGCLGGASCTSNCIEKKGYTSDCAGCFGTLTGCTKSHCMFNCMSDSKSTKCKNCVDEHCTPAFETCSGLTPPEN